MRRLLTTLVVLLVLVVAADRIAVSVAQRVVAHKLKQTGQLSTDPSVRVRGFPFLTQAFSGRYDRIDVDTVSFRRGGVLLHSFHTSLHGSRVRLPDALAGTVEALPVEGLRATAVVTYVDLAGSSRIVGLRVGPHGGQVDLTARLTVLGQSVSVSARSSVTLRGRTLVVTAQQVTILGQRSARLNRAIAGRLDFTVPIGTLPYGLALTSVRVGSAGIVLVASSGPTVLQAS